MEIISGISSKSLTKGTTFSNYLWIVDAYSKLPDFGMENITKEEAMYKLSYIYFRQDLEN